MNPPSILLEIFFWHATWSGVEGDPEESHDITHHQSLELPSNRTMLRQIISFKQHEKLKE